MQTRLVSAPAAAVVQQRRQRKSRAGTNLVSSLPALELMLFAAISALLALA